MYKMNNRKQNDALWLVIGGDREGPIPDLDSNLAPIGTKRPYCFPDPNTIK